MNADPSQTDPSPADPAPEPPERPAFDKEAARQRYRATMRGPFMRTMNLLLVLILLISWGFGIAAVFGKDIERLPDHGVNVPPSRCVDCHTRAGSAAPPMPHMAVPSCGFCHRQAGN